MSDPFDKKPVFPELRTYEPILGSRAGQLMGAEASGALLVDFPGNTAGPVYARLAVVVDTKTLQTAIIQRQKVVLLFENGDPRLALHHGLHPGAQCDASVGCPSGEFLSAAPRLHGCSRGWQARGHRGPG